MTTYIPESLREFVAERAASQCEYCQLPQTARLFRFVYFR